MINGIVRHEGFDLETCYLPGRELGTGVDNEGGFAVLDVDLGINIQSSRVIWAHGSSSMSAKQALRSRGGGLLCCLTR